MWDWPVYCDPKIVEEIAQCELPDNSDGMKRERRSHYSPAISTVAESSIWFFALL